MSTFRGTLAALVALLFLFIALTGTAAANDPHKVFVCKYVGTPGEDERLQTGDNPISVDIHAIPIYDKDDPDNDSAEDLVGKSFADQQGRSLVIAVDNGQEEPECPTDEPEPTPTPTPSPTPTPTPTSEPTPTPTDTPTATPTTAPSDTPTGTDTPRFLPPTDTAPTAETSPWGNPVFLLGLVFIGVSLIGMAMRIRKGQKPWDD